MLQIADFGAKIGGARKDLWSERGLAVSDLAGMNGREADKYVTKANVWPVPDYEAMVADGMPLCVAWYRKRVRDALIASPRFFGSDTPEKRLARQQQYVETVCELRAKVEQVETAEDAADVLNDFFLGGGYVRQDNNGICRRPQYFMEPTGQSNPVITNKLFRAVDASTDAKRFEADMTAEAARKGFLQKKVEKPAAKRTPRKKRYVPVQLQCVLREGPDYRGGREIKGADYIAMFGFHGGEFGNWMNRRVAKVQHYNKQQGRLGIILA